MKLSSRRRHTLETCCVVGAQSAEASTEVQGNECACLVASLDWHFRSRRFVDFKVNLTGKPTGIDIKDKKMQTLPLINALQNTTAAKRKQIIRTIKKDHKRPKKVAEVVDFVRNSGGLDYARSKMEGHLQKAADILSNFPRVQSVLL